MRELLEAELGGPSVFRDVAKLGFDYVPDALPGRDEEYRQLARALKPILQSPQGQHLMLTGPVGSGKTALTKRFCTDFKALAGKQGVNVEWVHVNCRRRSTEAAALLEILQHFDDRFPDRGFSNSEMLGVLRKQLDRRKAQLVVALDEADVLLKKSGSDLVYNLTRFHEEDTHPETSISLLLVSQGDARQHLDEAARSTFKRANTIDLRRYTAEGLQAIVHQRVGLAFHSAAFPETLEELVADAAAVEGDARYSIELLQKSGQLADDDGRPKVTAEDVRAAVAETHPFVESSKLRELTPHHRYTLLAIARALKKGDAAYAITGDVEKRYALVCEEHGDKPRAHTQFWTYLKELTDLGLIASKRSGKGVLGTTTLISLPDVPATVLERKLLEMQKSA